MEPDQDQRAELAALYKELHEAEMRAGSALGAVPDGHALEGEAAARFEEADNEVAALRRRIDEIEGRASR